MKTFLYNAFINESNIYLQNPKYNDINFNIYKGEIIGNTGFSSKLLYKTNN